MATVTVAAPDSAFAGTRAGVLFEHGRAEVDADDAPALAYFARHGYVVVEAPASAKRGRAKAAEAEEPAAQAEAG